MAVVATEPARDALGARAEELSGRLRERSAAPWHVDLVDRQDELVAVRQPEVLDAADADPLAIDQVQLHQDLGDRGAVLHGAVGAAAADLTVDVGEARDRVEVIKAMEDMPVVGTHRCDDEAAPEVGQMPRRREGGIQAFVRPVEGLAREVGLRCQVVDGDEQLPALGRAGEPVV